MAGCGRIPRPVRHLPRGLRPGRRGRGHLRGDVRRRRGPPRRRPRRRGPALRPGNHPRGGGARRREGDLLPEAGGLRALPRHGAEPGSKRVTCPTCRGAGQVRRSGGIIVFTQTCPTCGGVGQQGRAALHGLPGRGPGAQDDEDQRAHPAGGRHGLAPALLRQRRGRRGRRLARRPLHRPDRDASTSSSSARATTSSARSRSSSRSPRSAARSRCRPSSARPRSRFPPATQSGTTFRLRDKGMPSLRGGRQGDQLVRVHVEVPDRAHRPSSASFSRSSPG